MPCWRHGAGDEVGRCAPEKFRKQAGRRCRTWSHRAVLSGAVILQSRRRWLKDRVSFGIFQHAADEIAVDSAVSEDITRTAIRKSTWWSR